MKLLKATRLLLKGSGAVINGKYTTSVRDVIDCFQEGWESQVLRRNLSVDGSGTYLLLALGFISKGRQLLASGMSLPSVLEMLDEDLEVLKSNHSIYDVIKNIGSEDIVLNCMKYKGRHIVIDEHTDCRDDFIVEDNGYRVMYKSSGTSKDNVPVLVSAKVSDFADIEDYYGGILVTTEIEGEAKFTLEQMDVTLVLVDADGLYDMHNLMECDAKGRGKGSCEVHFDYTIMKGNGELPHIPKGQNGYVEALRSIRRNGKNGCVFIYVGGRNSYDKANRVREYRQCIFNMEHLKDGTTFGNGLGIMPKNVIHESGVNNLITGREGGVDSYWLVVDCIKKAKSVAKEILSVSRVVNKN